VFNGAQTNQPRISASQTVGQVVSTWIDTLYIANGTSTVTLTVTGGSPNCLNVSAGSSLTIKATGTGGNGILSVGTGGGVDSGTVTILGRAQVLSTDATNRLVFANGAVFNASQSTGNPFGTSSTGTTNSVEFKSGSTFNQNTGASNPFVKTAPASVVIFDTGSLYSINLASASFDPFGMSLSGRTYPSLTIGGQGGQWGYIGSGTGTCTVNGDLTINTGDTLYTGTAHFQVSGNITNNGYWDAASGDTVVLYNASSSQMIGGTGITVFNQAVFNDTASGSGGFNLEQGIIDSSSVIVGGIFRASMDSIYGPGNFTLTSGTTLWLGGAGGVDNFVKTTGMNSLSSGAHYYFAGGGPQKTGTMMPDTVAELRNYTSTGLTLSKTTAADAVTLTGAGNIMTGTDTLIALNGVNGFGIGAYVDGNLQYNVTVIGAWIFPVGSGFGNYLPVTLNFSGLTGSGAVVASVIDGTVKPPSPSPGTFLKVLRHYFKIGNASGITNFTASVTLAYTAADLAALGTSEDSTLHVYQSNGSNWIDVPVTSRDVTSKTITVSSLTSFGSFILGVPVPKLTIAQARVENKWVPIYSTNGDTIEVVGVVTSPNLGAASSYSSYFIQDSTAGIDVYSPTLMNFNIGDSVFVIGTVDQYNGLEEIVPLVGDSLHFGLLKQGAALPQPKHLTLSGFAIAQNAEMYEGQLIELDSLYKTSGTWPASGSSASIYVSNFGGTTKVQLYINKNTDVPGTKEHLYPVDVVGVVSQYGTDSTGYEIIPPDTTDIWKTPGLPSLATIAQAKIDANGDLIPDHKVTGDTLMIFGVITTPNMGSTTNYFMQDATGGIDVFKSGSPLSFSRGDSVSATGKITQYRGLTEISLLDSAHFVLLKHNAVIPKPKHLTLHQYVLGAEGYEGSLVEIDTLYKLGGSWGFGKDDSVTNAAKTDTTQIYLNAYTAMDTAHEPGYPINVIGVASQFSSGSSVVTGGYEIVPRDSTDITLTPPAVPTVIALAGATNQRADTLVLSWHPSATATKYLFQLSKDKFSTYAVNDSSVMDTTRKVTALTNGTKYFWRVAGYNAGGFSAFSAVDSFTTIPTVPAVPAVIALNGATNQRADTLALSWHPSTNATKYLFQLSEDRFLTYVVNDSNVVDTTRKVTALSNLTKYFWHVAAYNAGGFSAFSTVDSFTTIVAVPAKPKLVSPVGKTGVARMTTFVWDSTALATKYELQVASDKAFTTIVRDLTVKDTTVQLSDTLLASTTYYWRVSAIDTAGATASDTASFTTGTLVGVKELLGIPKEFALFQNYPNPFNPSTVIRYDLPKNSYVRVAIYDILGRMVASLVDGSQSASRYSVTWSPTGLSSGIYFCRIQAQSQDGSSNFTSVKKLLYVK
jgi:DNA/RNA endonuclease YhcR with UshA esterase domain